MGFIFCINFIFWLRSKFVEIFVSVMWFNVFVIKERCFIMMNVFNKGVKMLIIILVKNVFCKNLNWNKLFIICVVFYDDDYGLIYEYYDYKI